MKLILPICVLITMRKQQTENSNQQVEPSTELQLLAEIYLEEHCRKGLPKDKVLPCWCDYLKSRAPGVLNRPLMHLIKAVTLALEKAECQAASHFQDISSCR